VHFLSEAYRTIADLPGLSEFGTNETCRRRGECLVSPEERTYRRGYRTAEFDPNRTFRSDAQP